MKQRILLTLFVASLGGAALAQKSAQKVTAYAITANQKGSSLWTEVRLIDITSGEEVQSIYQSSKDVPVLNARTGKPVVKKEPLSINSRELTDFRKRIVVASRELTNLYIDNTKTLTESRLTPGERIVIRAIDDKQTTRAQSFSAPTDPPAALEPRKVFVYKKQAGHPEAVQSDKPFATSSAAAAYDKKHDRLYYTPLGINQLRYIDLKNNASVKYFEDEKFGPLAGRFDVANQITRMVIGQDGNGYALTNNAEHLIRFTTNKKAEVTDLGSLTDAAENAQNSVHSRNCYGGDMIAGESGRLYLITANKALFSIDVKSMSAKYMGAITGLPRGFTTNGAIAERDTYIIVSSAQSTAGYYRFDLKTLQAEKVSMSENVYNASDLANGVLVKDKKIKNEEQKPVEATQQVATTTAERLEIRESLQKYKMSVYPNPANNGTVNLLFADYPTGRYQVQFMDVSGKIFTAQTVNISNKNQVQQFRLPQLMGKGNYLVKVVGGEANTVLGVEQLVVQ
jgi:hypothetical protein